MSDSEPDTEVKKWGSEIITSENLGIDMKLDLSMMKLFNYFEEDFMAKRNCFWLIKHTWNPY